ncbi:hypothetical protein PFISCL1PPCAC_28956, partial [Pristionchus fissidentatus]
AMSSESLCRQNYAAETEAAINKQVNIELYASYVYLSMSAYFDRDDVALPNIAKFMRKSSDEEREHAIGLMKFQTLRGGRVVFNNVEKPEKDEWGSALEAFQAVLALEKYNNKSLLELHAIGDKHNDTHMTAFLEDKYLHEQVESINEVAKIVANLKRVGPGMGEYLFDKEHFE